MGSTIKSVLEAVTLNTLVLQTMDQLRGEKFLTILPHDLKGLADRPKGSHDHLFGDIKEQQAKKKRGKSESGIGGFPHAKTTETPPVWPVCQ